MADRDTSTSPAVVHTEAPAPIIDLNRIEKIATYEVQEMELEQLDELVASENQAVAFTTFAAGVFITTIGSWVSASTLSPTATAFYVGVTGVSFLATAWFGTNWIRVRRKRPALIARIRNPRGLPDGKAGQ